MPVEYFHVVFTLPESIAAIAYQNKAVVYDILFQATAETLRTIAAHPKHLGAEIGFIAILHTWGQNLLHHPHLHCVGPGGGLSPDGQRWVSCRPGFFLPVRVLSRLFRRLFLERLQQAFDHGELEFFNALGTLRDPRAFSNHLESARQVEWVVYAKPPFGGPEQVLQYLGRYTHRVAISNNRLIDLTDGKVSFHWKDSDTTRARRSCTWMARSSSAAFCCMCCRRDFSASATTACLAIGTALPSWRAAVRCWRRRPLCRLKRHHYRTTGTAISV